VAFLGVPKLFSAERLQLVVCLCDEHFELELELGSLAATKLNFVPNRLEDASLIKPQDVDLK
jgi:hypothetical protein